MSYVNPSIVEKSPLNITTMDVFSRLMMDRIVFIGSEINSDLANIINAQLLYLDSVSHNEITMYINSPGGSVYDGLSIYDTMQMIESPIKTVCIGLAASMASILLCSGDTRFALPHSRVLIHQPLGGVKGQASDILITAKEIDKIKKELYDIISRHTNQSFDKISIDADRDFYMTAEEAKEYGMIDDIIQR